MANLGLFLIAKTYGQIADKYYFICPQFVCKILQKFLFGILSTIGNTHPGNRIQNLMHKKGAKK